jgi:hypothetical protein
MKFQAEVFDIRKPKIVQVPILNDEEEQEYSTHDEIATAKHFRSI